jgi:Glycosyltransferase family 87
VSKTNGAARTTATLLILTAVVFTAGAVQKAPCADRSFAEQREGVAFQCYSDVGVLLRNEQLTGDRLPYLDACAPSAVNCDEYPPVTMYTMRAVAWAPGNGDPYTRFYWANAVVLLVCALIVTWCLVRMGAKAEMFAAAPTLAIYGTMNWDLIPVALTTGATLAFFRRRDALSGVLLGIGAAAKVYPAFVLVPFVGQRLFDGDRTGAWRLAIAAAAAWLVVDLPFMVAAFEPWSTFLRFNADRLADHGTLWHVVCNVGICASPRIMDVGTIVLTAGGTAAIWLGLRRRRPDFPRWTMAFPLLVLFFVASKVSSSQYILWILPWFALTARDFPPYAAEQGAEVLVYVTIFSFFAAEQGGEGLSYPWVAAALLLRFAALLWCLAVWYRRVARGTATTTTAVVSAEAPPIMLA